jgi:DNA polymerase I
MTPHAPITQSSHLYLIDASGYIFRAYHALPPLTRASDGLPVGAVSGFCNMLWKLLQDVKGGDRPTHLACIFDASGLTFRNDLYPAYKANRPPPPEDLVPQFPLVRDAARAFGTSAIELEGYEADDLIATYARMAEAAGAEVTIISSDKDLMQLVSRRVTLLDTMKNRRLSFAEVEEKFGVSPDKVVEVQALSGDAVDNIPGAPGIGPKTAAQLIQEFGDIENLIAHADDIKQPKRRETLIAHADAIRISRKLVELECAVPVPVGLESFAVHEPDPDTLIGFLEKMEFRTITKRVRETFLADGATPVEDPAADGFDETLYETITDLEALNRWIESAYEVGIVAVDTETTSLDIMRAELVGISLATGPNRACYIPLSHVTAGGDGGDLFTPKAIIRPGQIAKAEALKALEPLLSDPGVLKVGQNLKYDISILAREGLAITPFDDTMAMSFALGAGLHGHGMDELAERHFSYSPVPFKEVAGAGKSQITFDAVEIAPATRYAAEDADVTFRLWQTLKPRLRTEQVLSVYEGIERPLIPVIAQMEREGIKVDRDFLSRLSGDFAQRMAALEDEAKSLAGQDFNLASPKQIGDILFGEMGLPGGKKTKTGAWATGADALEELAAQGHDLPRVLLDWRQLSKLKSTYTDALREAINTETGRVHTSYSIVGAATGRLSSSDPNLQNIPIRTDEGRRIRQAFIAEPGHKLISADYSQIELRLLAHVADIEALKSAFSKGLDIHAMTASEMFGVPIEGMDPMIRRRAKAINFGIIYGISAFGLANQLGISQGEARDYIQAYFEKFPGIRAYMDARKAEAHENGFVRTLFGRKIWLKDIASKIPAQRAFAERQAINAPLQGAAADIIKRAMVRVGPALEAAGLTARLLLQVHDELILEAPDAQADAVATLVRQVMQGAVGPARTLAVPLVVEAGIADSWALAH